ncbi:MAG: hypothetical protein MJZ36_01790 [Bacteroidaceae bacterium]|nr:hypothetical protein [Bacteroidaceae bacterium]
MKKLYTFVMAAVASMMMCANVMAQETKYVKVKEAPADWSGVYLIVYEDDDNNQALILNGALEKIDAVNNFITAPNDYQKINGEDIRVVDPSDAVDAAVFTISKAEEEGIYYIVSTSGCGIGYNKFDVDENGNPIEEANMSCKQGKTYDNTIKMQEGKTNVIITSKVGYVLRYNADEGKTRFRYYESGKKKAIKLYRKVTVENGTITSIKNINAAKADAAYNLAGQKVDNNYRGIVIKNGVKVIRK